MKLKVKERYLKTLFSDASSNKAKSLHEAMKVRLHCIRVSIVTKLTCKIKGV